MSKVALVFFLICNMASANQDSVLKVFWNEKDPESLSASITWNLAKKSCQLKKKENKVPKALIIKECESLDLFLKNHAADLKPAVISHYNISERKRFQSEHLNLGLIEVSGVKFAFLKGAPTKCNLEGTKCIPTSDLFVDQLGFKVMSILDNN